MLNTGLALRRPYESQYNAYRRFLVANGNHHLHELITELKNLYPDVRPTGKRIDCMTLANIHEHSKSEAWQIPSDSTALKQFAGNPLRNCVECARSCYHSNIYQLPWLHQCPIHHTPLLEQCPDCHQPWPRPCDLPCRKCTTCGSKLSWADLKTSGAFKGFGEQGISLNNLLLSLSVFNKEVKGVIFSNHPSKGTWNEHVCIKEDHNLFPAMMAAYYPPFKQIYVDMGIDMPRIHKEIFALEIQTQNDINEYSKNKNKNKDKDLTRAIQTRVANRIKRAITRRFGQIEYQPPTRWHMDTSQYFKTVPNLLETSYYFWLGLVSHEHRKDNYTFNACLHFFHHNPVYRRSPPEPCLLNSLCFYNHSYYREQMTGYNPITYKINDSMKRLIYEIDLWRTYLNILSYLDIIRYSFRHHLSWRDLYDLLDTGIPKNDWDTDQYAVFQLNEDNVLILIPETYTKVSLDDFQLIS